MAVRYKTWQFGYNEKTDTCDQEITVKVDEQVQHRYERDVQAEGEVYICKDCGTKLTVTFASTETESQYKGVEEQTLTDGSVISWIYENRSEPRYGMDGELLAKWIVWERSEHVDAAGKRVWEETTYAYSIVDGGCQTTQTTTDSEGNSSESKYSGCISRSVTEKEEGCTQPGQRYWQCKVCGNKRDVITIDPDHQWEKQSDGSFRCVVCGMESSTGVSGNVILEDMTEKSGQGTNYVAGYWVKKGTVSQVNAVLIVDEQQILLECLTITKSDDPMTLSVAKSAVAELAKQKGYVDYQFRLVLTCDSLDYAITFTDETN